MKTDVKNMSRRVAQLFVLFIENKDKHRNGDIKTIGNTYIRKENDVVYVNVAGKPVITATPNPDTGEYTYLLEPRNAVALNRIIAIQEALNWKFQLTWTEHRPYILVGNEFTEENLEPIGALNRRTVEELEAMSITSKNLE
ncbi:MAG: hypothetical protein J6N72_04865 [Psychrobacter sp.]|nr:hypothetical protein [Psychrobacter sp.]